MKTILWLVVVFAVSAAKAQTLPPVKDIGKFDFWFYSPAFTRTFLDDLNAPEKGLTAVTPGGYEATYVALAHAKGLAYMGGLGGGSRRGRGCWGDCFGFGRGCGRCGWFDGWGGLGCLRWGWGCVWLGVGFA